jgi:hypothetical protein
MSHYDETRNRFNPDNRFIGDIEDGKKYPFGCYTKEESDERYAIKSTETDLTALSDVVSTKASQTDLSALSDVVDTKASTSDLESYESSNNAEIADIKARLDALEYAPMQIISFISDKTVVEKGSTQTIDLSWTLSKEATWQEINGERVIGASKSYTDVTADTTYTLSASDGRAIDTKSVSVSFANHILYGVTANMGDLTGLSDILSENVERTFTATAAADQYIVYAYPKRLGSVEFFVEGWEGGFDAPAEASITNRSGYTETYYIYKSTNTNLGVTTVEVRREI